MVRVEDMERRYEPSHHVGSIYDVTSSIPTRNRMSDKRQRRCNDSQPYEVFEIVKQKHRKGPSSPRANSIAYCQEAYLALDQI
jgi:hypothetical protein